MKPLEEKNTIKSLKWAEKLEVILIFHLFMIPSLKKLQGLSPWPNG